VKLRPFQREGVRQIYRFGGRAILADEMGLGKTIQALYWITKIPHHRPVVIVTPATVKYCWQAEAGLHFGLHIIVLEGSKGCRLSKPPGPVLVLNYDILGGWLKTLLRWRPQVVIFDEAHYIKSMGARRTRYALRLARDAASVLALSGTPLTNRPIELWPILQAVRPDLFPSLRDYGWRYCRPRYTPWGWMFDGASNLDELHRILRHECLIRRRKKDVLSELPAKSRHIVPFRLESYDEYRRAQEDFLGWLRAISPAKANRASRSEALTKIGYLLRLVAQLKIDWVLRWMEDFFANHPGEKMVALTMHTFVVDAVMRRFQKRAVMVDGRVVGRLRQETVRRFQTSPRVDLLIGNWRAAGVGITLHASRTAVAIDLPWTPGDLLQGEDRIHRIGQHRDVIIHYLVALGTIEEKQIKILHKKTSILDAILDGRAKVEDFDLLDALLKAMRREDNMV